MKLVKLFSNLMVICILLLSQQAYAARGISSDNAGPHFSGLHNQETIEDIRLKVLGGDVRINRVWRGEHWEWNERWGQLQPMLHSMTDASGETTTSVLAVYRAGQLYRKTSETAEQVVYENQLNQFITKTATEYVWHDRKGNGITYDLDGRVINYFDKNKVYVYLERDANGDILSIKDHHQNTVLSLTYETYSNPEDESQQLQRIKTLTDYAGRTVIYGWNNNHQLETVTDVRGQVWTYVYSDNGLLTQLKDPDGRVTRYEIEKTGKFISRFNTDGVGERYQYNYDKENQIYYMSKIDGTGRVEETWNNAMGLAVRESNDGEDKRNVEYILSDGSKGVESIIKNYSYRVEYWYRGSEFVGKTRYCGNDDQSNNPDSPCLRNDPNLINKPVYVKYKKVIDTNGDVTTYENDQWKNEIGVTYPDGTSSSRKLHSQWSLPISETNEKGITTTYEYDTSGNLITLVEAKGTPDERTTRYTYDEFGQIKTKITGESVANNTELAVTYYEYDQYGNIIQVMDPEGNITHYSDHDALGNAQTIIDARAHLLPVVEQYTWKNTYDAAGNLLTRRDPYNKGETYTYTKTGDLETVIAAGGSKVTLTSNANGQPLTITDDNNKVTKLQYDKAGRLTVTTDANGNKSQTAYDAQGRVFRSVDGEGNTTQYNYVEDLLRSIQYPTYKELLEYDNRNRVKQTTQQANSRNYIRKHGYDPLGNITNSTDAQDNETVYEYDVLSRVKKITDAEGGVTEFSYDARDNLLQVKDPEGRLTIYTYDKNDRLLTETKDGDQNTDRQRRYAYDQNGNLIGSINPEQEMTTYEFDQANRLVKTQVFANKDHTHPIKVINYHFNDKNQLTNWSQQVSTSLPDGVTPTADVIPLSETYTYNNLEQLESVAVNFGSFTKTYRYSYYPNGLKKTYTNPEGITYTYFYNKNNQLMAVHIPGEGQISWTAFSWMVPQTLLLPGGQKISFKYDDFQQLQERVLKKANNTELAKAVYEYDLEQNIKKIERGEGIFNYGYDNLYRLTTADSPEGYAANDETFGYDGVGNRTTHTENGISANQSYNQKNQLQAIDDANDTTYTYNANGHTKTQTKNSITTEYRYNHEERLIEVKRDDTTIAEYAYNPHGQRVKKTVNGVTTWYLYNGNGLAAEYSSTGQLIKEYHFHPQKTWMTDPLFQRTAAGEVYYYHNDHLGTPQQMLDDAGNIVWEAQYSAFGKAHITIDTVENNLRFPGQYFDSETGLHHNYFRDYDSALGRYIQSDPIGLGGGFNTYVYAYQNPAVLIDPLGLYVPSDLPENCKVITTGSGIRDENDVKMGPPTKVFQVIIPFIKFKKKVRDHNDVDGKILKYELWKQTITYMYKSYKWMTYYVECQEEDECGNHLPPTIIPGGYDEQLVRDDKQEKTNWWSVAELF
ncbi:RHS repeat-associated core domain-containing protein [Cellvibrio japonicus]|uniref:Rhsfamily protein n=1 Tax=Cellvibrio japonicus (strain Ueda107) TaxID=498211 RepID=B3PEN8_CELJU|nr:RHS repeat-associated core domain-containing protein [Cellvibrio japonicus]ACE86285.1 Rhsfamily protein [Cellvibrio japonicus Ueda107]QEI10778.1 RHS repeat protein [Cellvibrio japonicus]QEI14354.1 RHS repeat protein [Cellvibrio japonicus]QEI17932.1 RHS repeat protein [Cellvibrio japonicus]